jgi:NAD(P)H-hydrate repair Nnr-like enzyme with NAD(P)H-hydrate epimerase domain
LDVKRVSHMTDEPTRWLVLRTDDAGNSFVAADALDEAGAETLVHVLTARGHKQTYAAFAYADPGEKQALLARYNVRA